MFRQRVRVPRGLRSLGPSVGYVHNRQLSLAFSASQSESSQQEARSWVIKSLLAAGMASVAISYAESEGTDKVYRRSEIAQHNTMKDCWVTYNGNVYDITSFIPNHPGGHEKIMLAAGGDIESFWNLYRQHFNSSTPLDILSKLQIGVLHPDDLAKEEKIRERSESSGDPYENDPQLAPFMRILSSQPINAEPPAALLSGHFITPTEAFFVRNHHPVPHIDPKTYKLQLSAQKNEREKREYEPFLPLSLHDLLHKFPRHEVTSTIQCGGNRRQEMTAVEKTNGANWAVSAISTAKWSGVALRDVLLATLLPAYQITEDDVYSGRTKYQHVHFVSADGLEASIPLRKALQRDGDCLLALHMNDEVLPEKHGFPVRAIVPGHVGVRNVKWVREIRLSEEEAYGAWQRGMAYKGFGPSVKSLEGIDVEAIPSLQEQPVQSAITSLSVTSSPSSSSSSSSTPLSPVVHEGDRVTLRGYAYSGGGRGVVRVDVSVDGGQSWVTATLKEGHEQPLHRAWAWTLWEADTTIPLQPSSTDKQKERETEVIVKATDASYNVQPDSIQGIWNLRGINNNAWHRVRVKVLPREEGV